MQFELRPILSEMKELYLKPISTDRFQEYISKLQGNTKGDLSLPISGFNPMAKEHVLQKIRELQDNGAEMIMKETIAEFNATWNKTDSAKVDVVLNLADDLKGGWTNYYATDFDSKFKINALVNRNFCTPYFWTSENYTKELIKNRTTAYLSRTLFWIKNSKPKTLDEYLAQEIFVNEQLGTKPESIDEQDFSKIEKIYLNNKESEAYSLLFNFFYGDNASDNLGYKKFGIIGKTGFDYAQFMALKRKTFP
ncbi:MAG: hypothetical protein WBG90_14470 [Saonia sp.]